ncbi:MAG: amino acid adenylation domain-containing protein [Pseudomonadota bacterium]
MLDQKLMEMGQGEHRPYSPRNFYDRLTESATASPDATALLFRGERQSYGELTARAGAVRKALADMGVTAGDRVAFLLDPSLDLFAVMIGVLSAGCAYVPVSNKEAVERAAHILTDSGAAAFITSQAYAHRPLGGSLRRILTSDIDWSAPDVPAPVITHSGAEAYVIYTSGTTGAPKGVVITHHSMVQFGESISALYETTPDDVVQYFYSPSVDTSVEEMCLAFFAGATLSIATETERHAPPRLAKAMAENGVTICILPLKIAREIDAAALPALRLAVFGGEAVHAEIVNKWQAPGRKVYNGYGPTEATVACIQKRCDGAFDAPPPIGRPMANHFALLLQDDGVTPAPLGEMGEIAIAGPGVALGYLNRPELTADKFTLNPYARDASQAVFYRTGDYGRWNDDGDIEYHGRKDDQVKINGHRVEISEIENAFLKFPGVDFAAVISEGAAGDLHLHAFVKTDESAPPSGAAYRRHLHQTLPFQMIPRKISFLREVPLTRSGKVDRKRLREFVSAGPEAHPTDNPTAQPEKEAHA